MADLAPIKERLAKCIRLFGSAERANARNMTERALASVGASWTDLGDWFEQSKYTADQLHQYGEAMRAEGVEVGIKIGEARKSNGGGNGHLMLPKPSEMAEYCQQRPNQLKDDAQRKFINEMYASTQRGRTPPRGPLGYLASIYIKLNGRI